MPQRSFKSLRWQLTLLIVLAVGPISVLVIYTSIEHRNEHSVDTRDSLARQAGLAANEQIHRIEAAHQLLFAVSNEPGILDPETCRQILPALARELTGYLDVVVLRTDGTVVCAGHEPAPRRNFSSERWFGEVLRRRDLVVAGYELQVERRRPALRVAHPIPRHGPAIGVIFASLDFSWVARMSETWSETESRTFTVLTENGEVLARYPATSGGPWGVPTALVRDILARGAGAADEVDRDGVPRVYAFTPLAASVNGRAWIVASMPARVAYGRDEHRVWRDLVALAAVAVLSFLLAAWALQRFTLRPLRAVLRTTRRIAAGDLAARTGVRPGTGEVSELAAAFDHMAASLETQRREVRDAAARVRTLVDQSLVGVYVFRSDTVLYVNDACARIAGRTSGEMVGHSALSMIQADDRERVLTAVRRYITQSSGAITCTFRVVRPDGASAICEMYGRRIEYDGGPATLGTMLDVTDREMAADALRASEARFRAVFEQANSGMALLDIRNGILEANASLERMAGCGPDGLRGRNICGMLSPGCADESGDACLLDAKWEQAEHRLLRPDGSSVWVSVTRSPMKAEGSGGPRSVVIVEDISPRKAAEEELVRLRLAVEASGEVIFITDREGIIRFVNPAFTRVYGYTADEVVGRETPRIIKSGLLSPETYAGFWGTILKGEVTHGEIPNRTKDGRLITMDGSANPVFDHGEIVGFLAIQRDVSARKRAEHERDRLASVVEQMAESTIVFDADDHFVYVNPAFERLTGYTAAEVLGQPLALLRAVEPDDEFHRARWEHLRAGGTWTGHIAHRRKDGSVYTEETTITPIRDADGRIHHFVAVGQDVAERRSLEMQLRQSQKMEAVGRLAGGIAHDFNNLLTVILGQGEMLEQYIERDAAAQRHAEAIRAAAERASRLTRQLLAFSRRQQMSVRPVNLRELVDSVAGMLRRLIGEDVVLHVVHAADLGTVRADPVQIEQVLMNLAVNARDAMPGGGSLTIETQDAVLDRDYADRHVGAVPGDYVQITVTDTGQGMTEETRSRIFEPFFTTKGPGKGTGLGLSTVYGIVKQHGGSIWLYSEIGRGTAFTIYLPRTGVAALSKPRDGGAQPTGGSETVLLVEDDDGVRELLAESVARYGYRVLASSGGEEAQAIVTVHDGPIHLMLTDVVMPGMNGPELYERLAPQRPDMRVLFMSGYTDLTVLQADLIGEQSSFIAKPFTHSDLARKIRRVLDDPVTVG